MDTAPIDNLEPSTSPDRPPGEPARLAEPDEGITIDELRLATRNHGMPLEALRYDITPAGLHYVLVHYDIPHVDREDWRLAVTGHVARPMELDFGTLSARPRVTRTITLECAGNGRARLTPRPISQPWVDEAVGTARWTGTPLAPLLREAQPQAGAADVVFTGYDHGIERGVEQDYARGLSLADALDGDVLLAYEMNGAPLPPQHGAPVRLIAPGWYGMAHVKWLRAISVTTEPFAGYQNATTYRIKQHDDDAGEPVTRIKPRALMIPPGFPDFLTRRRIVDSGDVLLVGRAWSGEAPVNRVEVSTDDGQTWADAELGAQPERFAWRAWTYPWSAWPPGEYILRVRATDTTGDAQPVDQPWNRQGMANNMAQQVAVTVRRKQH